MKPAVYETAGLAALALTMCLILSTAVAVEYSWQVLGGYRDADSGGAAQAHRRSLRAAYHLAPVDDAAGPHELAPFLNRASHVAVGLDRTNLHERRYPRSTAIGDGGWRIAGPTGGFGFGGVFAAGRALLFEPGIDVSGFSVEGRYVWPASGWYAGAHAQRDDGDSARQTSVFRASAEFRRTGLLVGRYVAPRTAVEVEIVSENMIEDLRVGPFDDPLFGRPVPDTAPVVVRESPVRFGVVMDERTDRARVSVRHVGEVGGSTFEFAASVRASRSDTRSSMALSPNPALSANPFETPDGDAFGLIGAGPGIQSGWFGSERAVRLSGALFPNESLGLRLTVETSDRDAQGTRDLVGLSATWFFVRNAALGVELTRNRSGRSRIPASSDADSVRVALLGRF